ncbi:MAG: phosphate signaling complex protein PhoU [Betaproteobacteria bacterium]|nr:phosphate signaling complex protein PhoU [Betaproteobacteria bacterium]
MPENQHVSTQFDADLDALVSQVLRMGGLVEQQIVDALAGFGTGEIAALDRVIAMDHEVNAMEVGVDRECSRIIAKRQPTARDLRLMMAIIKTITDLERSGDEAAKIARLAKQIFERERLKMPRISDIKTAADIALGMLRKVLDAFARLDAVAAAAIIREDQAIDDEFRSILRQLITFMMEDPRTISMSIEIVFIAKAIERIGDHAKNIAEYVIYIVKGTDVRHTSFEFIEREAQS